MLYQTERKDKRAMNYDLSKHPLKLFLDGNIILPAGARLYFCAYHPNQVVDTYDSQPEELYPYSVSLDKLSVQSMEQTLQRLEAVPERELGLVSQIWLPESGEEAGHLLLVDFVPDATVKDWDRLRRKVDVALPDLLFVTTGRALHGYGRQIFPSEQWSLIMSKIAEGNLELENEGAVIDDSWLLISANQGFSWLRWSWNDKERFVQMPEILQPIL